MKQRKHEAWAEDIEEGDILTVEKTYCDYEVGSGGPISLGIKFKGVKDIWWITSKQ